MKNDENDENRRTKENSRGKVINKNTRYRRNSVIPSPRQLSYNTTCKLSTCASYESGRETRLLKSNEYWADFSVHCHTRNDRTAGQYYLVQDAHLAHSCSNQKKTEISQQVHEININTYALAQLQV